MRIVLHLRLRPVEDACALEAGTLPSRASWCPLIDWGSTTCDREVAGSILSHGMISPGSRETVGESRRKGTALVLATLRRTASIAG
jgi:hypothetical protein